MKNSTYDCIKWIGLIAVPVITFIVAIVNIWGFPHSEEVIATLSAIDVLIGSIVAIAKSQYDRKQKNIEDQTYY
jgi:hypothetical protein